MSTKLTLPEPPSANRWWRRAGNHMHLSNEARAYKESLDQLRGLRVLVGPVRITLDWYRGRRAGDLDKRIGVCLDALQGVLFDNDSQIIELRATRHDDPTNPRIEVTVEPA